MTGQTPQENQTPKTRQELEAMLVAKAWEDEAFKEKFLSNPKEVLEQEVGHKLPENVKVTVIEETVDNFYIVLPKKPNESEMDNVELDEEMLDQVAGGYGPWMVYGSPTISW
jgi:hypothetical protein